MQKLKNTPPAGLNLGKKTNLVRPKPSTAGMGGFVWEELPLDT